MQTLLDQEKQTTQDMEGLGEDLLKDKQKLDKALETLQADKDRQVHTTSNLTHAKCTTDCVCVRHRWSLFCHCFPT